MPSSKLKVQLAELLKTEGYINGYEMLENGVFKTLKIALKYTEEQKPVISNLKRVSKPGLRVYKKSKNIERVYGGLGIAIVSTSKGLITDRKARKENIGGEVLCHVW